MQMLCTESLWQNRERNKLQSGVWMDGVRIYGQGYIMFEVTEFLCGIPIVISKFMCVIPSPSVMVLVKIG